MSGCAPRTLAAGPAVTEIQWPPRWQEEAKRVISRYFGRDARLRIVVDDPASAIDGSVLEGFVYLDGVIPTIIHDRSGRPDVYPCHCWQDPCFGSTSSSRVASHSWSTPTRTGVLCLAGEHALLPLSARAQERDRVLITASSDPRPGLVSWCRRQAKPMCRASSGARQLCV